MEQTAVTVEAAIKNMPGGIQYALFKDKVFMGAGVASIEDIIDVLLGMAPVIGQEQAGLISVTVTQKAPNATG